METQECVALVALRNYRIAHPKTGWDRQIAGIRVDLADAVADALEDLLDELSRYDQALARALEEDDVLD